MFNKKAISIVVLLSILLSTLSYWFYSTSKSRAEHEALMVYEKQLGGEINALISSKGNTSIAIALTLSENPQIKSFLCDDCDTVSAENSIKSLTQHFADYTEFGELWVQVIDPKGISLFRSWTSKKGDDLSSVRKDVIEMIANPRVFKTLGVGKFSLAFKSMVPIFDKQKKLLGIVEVISQFESLTERLKSERGVESVVLVDKRYQGQLTKARTGLFIKGHYVVNKEARPRHLKALEKRSLEEAQDVHVAHDSGYYVSGAYVLGRHLIINEKGERLGVWYTFSQPDEVNFQMVDKLAEKMLYGMIVLFVLLVGLFFVYLFKRQSDQQKEYYQQVLNSASEIIFVSDRTGIVEANQHFFEFYTEVESLEAFLKKYGCISETFAAEEGYLQKTMAGVTWYEYVANHPSVNHIAKIYQAGEPHYFRVKVTSMHSLDKVLFTILLLDITREELYKEQLEQLSLTDALTGISNRLYFNRNLRKEIQRAHRYQTPLSLIMFDVDHFKQVNDTFGHDVGDRVLIELSNLVQSQLRDTDMLCRFGGEEFMIILPETELSEAQQTAERLREIIANSSSEEFPTPLTVSFGVAHITKWDSEKTLLKRIDQALYLAKERGRNRVVLATE
ncbi:MAG: diguanylate cyclase [Gammaproteobacteria bacterium]|nr:diguanylate cyclase [Gammaproteobacteria bacterium]